MGAIKIQERAVVWDVSATDLQLPTFAFLTTRIWLKAGKEGRSCMLLVTPSWEDQQMPCKEQ